MKKQLLTIFTVVAFATSYGQNIIHYWSFNSGSTTTASAKWTSPISADSTLAAPDTASMTHNITKTEDFAGNSANAPVGVGSGGAFCPQDMANNGNGFTLLLPSTGKNVDQLSWWMRRTSSGFDSLIVEYSTNGTTFMSHPQSPVLVTSTSSSGTVFMLDFDTIAGADSNANFSVRFTLYGATSGTGNARLDNLMLTEKSATPPPPPAPIPHYALGTVTSIDSNGVADSLNVSCSISGVVHGLDMSGLSSSSNTFQVYDATGAIQVYKSRGFTPSYTVLESDSVTLYGRIGQYNGLMQFEPDSMTKHSTGAMTMAYTKVSSLGEATENKYIRLDSVVLVNASQWPAPNNNANVDIKTLAGDTVVLRIDRDGYVDDSVTAPAGMFDIIGYGSQFDNSSPYTSGYQILPQRKNDIIIYAAASCNDPTMLDAKKLTDVSAELDWVTGGSTIWNIEYGPMGFTKGSGTMMTVTQNPYVLTGLTASTDYDFYVQDSCTGTGVSGWAGPKSFKTLAAPKPLPMLPIKDIKSVDSTKSPDSLGVKCWITGTVYTKDFDGNNGISFYIMDGSGGMNIFNFNDVSNYVVKEGDSIKVRGEVDFYRGLIELFADSIVLIDSNKMYRRPKMVSWLDESTESEFIELRDVYLADTSQWPAVGRDANVDIVTPNNDTLTMRIDRDTDVDDMWPNPPMGNFTVKGAGSQFDPSSPYDEGYQIFPRWFTDIDTASPPPCRPSSNLSTSDITSSSVKVSWTAGGGVTWNVGWAKDHSSTHPTDSTMGVTTISHVITGLDSNQHYHIWIQDVCDMGPPSMWEGPVMFSTLGANSLEEVFSDRVALRAYPNPNNTGLVKLNKTVDFVLLNIVGQPVMEMKESNSLSVSDLESGMYIIQSKDGDTVRLIIE